MKPRTSLVSALLVLAGPAARAAAPAVPASGFIQYQQRTSAVPGRAPLTMTVKLWFKGRRYRQETDYARGKLVVIGGPSVTYVLLPGGSGATMIPAAQPHRPGMPFPPLPPRGIPGLMFPEASVIPTFTKKVGTEKVGPYSAAVYETHSHSPGSRGVPPSEMTSRFWISPSLPVPVKVVYQNTPGATTTTVLQTAQLNTPVPDRLFQLPPGTKVHPAPGR